MDRLLALGAEAGALLKARRETVAIAESATGGLVAAALLAVPGASAYFLGGAVVYTRQARTTLLGLPLEALKAAAPASEEMARLLAEGAKARLGSSWGLGEAGATGPTGNSYGHAAGHGVFAVAGPVAASRTIETSNPERWANMQVFSETLLEMLVAALRQAG
jgi:nicotinamide-nucleotide amidase